MTARSVSASLLCLLLGFLAPTARAQVALPKVLGDNMLLQRDRAVPIWGTAAPGEQVTVRFGSQSKSTRADTSGNWKVSLDPLPASSTPAEMTVSGTNTLTVRNILV